MSEHAAVKHPFQSASEGKHPDFGPLLAADVVLHSPVMNLPFTGRDTVAALLPRIRGLFERMTYTMDLTADGARALLSDVRIAGLDGENIQILRLDPGGLITDVTILVRPLPVAMAVVEALDLIVERQPDGTFSVALPGGRPALGLDD